ncbi:MAG: hypothetical protein KY475_10750 [Planctomycetes bacterium]|nr:hypothetical protein [Planctomycetota bacterium]
MTGIDRQQVNGFIVKAFASGPDRAVDAHGRRRGKANDQERASQMEIHPDAVFVREDGWTPVATYEMSIAARRLWQGRWVACLDLRTSQVFFSEEGRR